MKNKGVWIVIALILAAGICSTKITRTLVTELSGKSMPQPAAIVQMETQEEILDGQSPITFQAPQEEPISVEADLGSDTHPQEALLRLEELDRELEKKRTKEADGTPSAKQRSENELKLWQTEMDQILNLLEKSLDSVVYTRLFQEQNEWVKSREAKASEASTKMNNSSLGEVEYTNSLVRDTRLRAYELVNRYADNLN